MKDIKHVDSCDCNLQEGHVEHCPFKEKCEAGSQKALIKPQKNKMLKKATQTKFK
jgi:hypothetical protein